MERPGDIIITVIITTGHRITGRRLTDRHHPSVHLRGRQIALLNRQAALLGRHRCLQEDKIIKTLLRAARALLTSIELLPVMIHKSLPFEKLNLRK
jgi:hypothetical protein